VGRGAGQSYCILVTGKLSDIGRQRVGTMVDSSDGFYIAEMDLKLRGPGEFFGTKQSGLPALRIANILRDAEILEIARREAKSLFERLEDDPERARVIEYLRGHWQRRFGMVLVG
jgi:ATP-dependent DNA helicase RecG